MSSFQQKNHKAHKEKESMTHLQEKKQQQQKLSLKMTWWQIYQAKTLNSCLKDTQKAEGRVWRKVKKMIYEHEVEISRDGKPKKKTEGNSGLEKYNN